VVLSVIDTGCGMDERTRARALEPFFTTKEPGRGTGLGLWTVYGIVKREGGRLQITSAPGQGTTISVQLPSFLAAAAVAGRATIMLVEDEKLVRMTVRDYLERGGHEVLEAGNGEDALAVLCSRERPIDVLLTDVSLPHMLGSELAEKVRELAPPAAVIFMSAFPEELLRREGRLPEGAAAIEKPFTAAELLLKVSAVLKMRSQADE
jgi:CheY-like chemotaxis protein